MQHLLLKIFNICVKRVTDQSAYSKSDLFAYSVREEDILQVEIAREGLTCIYIYINTSSV